MQKDKTYTIDQSRAISETLDGETIIIDLESGIYYSLNETGSLVWEYLKSGHSLDQIIQYFVNNYGANVASVEKAILDLLDSLEKNNLVKQSETSSVLAIEYKNVGKKDFMIPAIQKYEDMQEMLLADPIHDVNNAGWPELKENK